MQLPDDAVFTPGKWAVAILPQCHHNGELAVADSPTSGDSLGPHPHSFCFAPQRLLPSVIFSREKGSEKFEY